MEIILHCILKSLHKIHIENPWSKFSRSHVLWTECLCLSKTLLETLVLTVMISGGGVFGSNQVIRVRPSWMGFVPLGKKKQKKDDFSLSLSLSLSLSHCHMRTQRRWLSANQEENSHRPQPLIYIYTVYYIRVSQVAKNSPANAEDKRDAGSIPGLRRSPGGGHGIPLQYSCLENPMDKWAWRVHSPRGHKESDTTEVT